LSWELWGLNRTVPVIVSGGGPVGFELAIVLGQHGVRCIVVEQHAGASDAFAAAARRLGVPSKIIRNYPSGGREKYAVSLTPARPDRFAPWTLNGGDFDTAAILTRVARPAT
jgi:hypothetical protein